MQQTLSNRRLRNPETDRASRIAIGLRPATRAPVQVALAENAAASWSAVASFGATPLSFAGGCASASGHLTSARQRCRRCEAAPSHLCHRTPRRWRGLRLASVPRHAHSFRGRLRKTRQRRGVRWQALARHRCRLPDGVLRPQDISRAPDSGVADARLRPRISATALHDAGAD